MYPVMCSNSKSFYKHKDFANCIKIPIQASPDGALTDFQVRLSVVKGIGTNEAGTVYLQNGSLNWPYDINFFCADRLTPINFWRQEYDSTDGTWIIQIPSVASSGNTDIYLYYGNANQSDLSNVANTAKDGAGYEFPRNGPIDTNFWNVVSGSPFFSLAPEYPPAASGVAVANDVNKYEAFPTIIRDSTGRLYIFYRISDSNTHGYEASGRAAYKTSDDDGATWSSEISVTTIENMDERDAIALVFSNNGIESILLAYTECDVDINCRAYCQIAPISTMEFGEKIALSGSNNRATHGNPVQLSNGTIIIPLFNIQLWRTYVVKSNDNGASWSEYVIGTDTTHQINETALIELKTAGVYAGAVAAITRSEVSPYSFYKSLSSDFGDTWSSYASVSTPFSLSNPCPPELTRMPNDGIMFALTASNDVVCCLSEDEALTWQPSPILIDRGASEIKHYVKVLHWGEYAYAAWCTNLADSSDVYFNKIKMEPYLRCYAADGTTPTYRQGPAVSMPAILECRMQFLDDEATRKYPMPFGFGQYKADYSTDSVELQIYTSNQYCLTATTSGARSITSGITKDLNWSIWKIIWKANSATLYADGTLKGTELTTNIPSASMPLVIGRTAYANAASRCYLDWMFTRKYTTNEPVWNTPGNTEVL